MKSIVCALFAVVLYSFGGVLLEQKFSKYNVLTLMVCYLAIIWSISFFARLVFNDNSAQFAFPKGWDLFLIFVFGAMLFVADFLYVDALKTKGNIFVVMSILAMMPVCAIAIRYAFFEKGLPNIYHFAGFVAAFVSILFITKGALVEKAAKAVIEGGN